MGDATDDVLWPLIQGREAVRPSATHRSCACSDRQQTRRTALRGRLIQICKAPKPDIVSVVLNSDGFVDLLERGEFIKRVSDQDREIVGIVRRAKNDAMRSEGRLKRLERRQQTGTPLVRRRRDEVSAVRMELVGTRLGYMRTKHDKAAALGRVRDQRVQLQSNVDELGAASRRIMDQLQAAQRRNNNAAPEAPSVSRGTGWSIFPQNGPITSPLGRRRTPVPDECTAAR